jgi:hypothetical protein
MSSTRPSLPLNGGCVCGAIRYEIGSFPLLLYTNRIYGERVFVLERSTTPPGWCRSLIFIPAACNRGSAADAVCHETQPSDVRTLAQA